MLVLLCRARIFAFICPLVSLPSAHCRKICSACLDEDAPSTLLTALAAFNALFLFGMLMLSTVRPPKFIHNESPQSKNCEIFSYHCHY